MPFYRDSQQFIRDLQRDRATAFNEASNLLTLPTGALQGSASILGGLIKINGIMPRLLKWQQNLHKKRHFCLKSFYKKALLFNEKALLFKKLLYKINANLLKRIKKKNALFGRAFSLWA